MVPEYDEELLPANKRGRSPGPREKPPGTEPPNMTGLSKILKAQALQAAQQPAGWTAMAYRLQAEEQARVAAIRGLEVHIDQAVAALAYRMQHALQTMQESVESLVDGAANAAVSSELDELKKNIASLEDENSRQEERFQSVEERLTELKALQTGAEAEQKETVLQLSTEVHSLEKNLTVRLDAVSEEHRKLDNIVADIAKLGLAAAQVARQTRATPPRVAHSQSRSESFRGPLALAGSPSPGGRQPTPAITDDSSCCVSRQASPTHSAVPPVRPAGSPCISRKSTMPSAAPNGGSSTANGTGTVVQSRHTIPPLQVSQMAMRAVSPQPTGQGEAVLGSSSSCGHLTQQPGWQRLARAKAQASLAPNPPSTSSMASLPCKDHAMPELRCPEGNRSPCGSVTAPVDTAPQATRVCDCAQASEMRPPQVPAQSQVQGETRQPVPNEVRPCVPPAVGGPITNPGGGALSARRSPRVSTGSPGARDSLPNGTLKGRYPSPQALWR